MEIFISSNAQLINGLSIIISAIALIASIRMLCITNIGFKKFKPEGDKRGALFKNVFFIVLFLASLYGIYSSVSNENRIESIRESLKGITINTNKDVQNGINSE